MIDSILKGFIHQHQHVINIFYKIMFDGIACLVMVLNINRIFFAPGLINFVVDNKNRISTTFNVKPVPDNLLIMHISCLLNKKSYKFLPKYPLIELKKVGVINSKPGLLTCYVNSVY